MTVLVKASGLRKVFGNAIVAVDGISLSVKKGEVLGFLGPNGAGKSTTMKMLTGFLEPTAGQASICGHDIQDEPKRAKSNVGYLPEGAPAYGEMTPAGYLDFISEIRGFTGNEKTTRIAAAVDKAGLHGVLGQRIETLSKGYKRRVGIAQSILHDPAVLIMDEPTDGLDPNQKHHVRNLIREMAEDKAIIVSTHILEEVEAACTRAVVINKGKIVADGTADDLMRRVPYHGAVAVRVADAKADTTKNVLAAIGDVAKVEIVSKTDGATQIRAIPHNNKAIATDVAAKLREENVPVEELFVERGKLDDVFRQITSGEDASHA